MFERFTESARKVVGSSGPEALRRGRAEIGTGDLLLGILARRDDAVAQALAGIGVTYETACAEVERIDDGDALSGQPREISKDLSRGPAGHPSDTPTRQPGDVPTHGSRDASTAGERRAAMRSIPFTPPVKRALQLALAEATSRDVEVGFGELLLGLARERDGIAAKALAALGVDTETIRARLGEPGRE